MIRKIVIFILLFISGGAIVNIDNVADYFYPVYFVLLFVLLLTSKRKIKILKKTFWSVLVFLLLFILLIIIRNESFFFADNFNIIVKLVLLLLLSIYVATFYEEAFDFYKELVNVFEFLLKLSFVTFILINIFPFLLLNVGHKTPIGDQYQTFFGIAFTRLQDYHKYGFYRNQGVFWESGVYGVMTIIVYVIKRLYFGDKKNFKLYLIAVLSSFSLGSIIIFLLLILLRYILSGSQKQVESKLSLLSVLIALPLIVLFDIFYYYSSYIETFLGIIFHRNLSNDSSINTRYQDLYYGFLASYDRFFVGHGRDFSSYYKLTLQELNKSKAFYDGGITNSIISTLYCYGIFYLILYFIHFANTSKTLAKNQPLSILVFFTLIGVLMVEPLQNSLLILFFIMYRDSQKIALQV